jgi:hypothetical protein
MLHGRKLHTPQDSAMKAIVIYDDLAIATKAITALQRASHHPNAAVKWNLRPWRIDMLTLQPTADQAIIDGADAHLIVFALRRASSLPVGLIDWLEQWAALRHTPDAGLAIIGEGNAKASLAQATVELSQFARRCGLTVICDNRGEINDESAFFRDNSTNSESSALSTHPELRRGANHGAHYAWGINE